MNLIPEEQWRVSCRAFDVASRARVRFLIGGGFGLAFYTGRWRNTKDIDLYVHPADRERMIRALQENGFEDYYSIKSYDRGWIYRSVAGDVIVDTIWSFANRRADVDETWFRRAPEHRLRDRTVAVVPPEELLWSKLYVLQGDHCDWPDLLNLLYFQGLQMDWRHLRNRVGDDVPLVEALLSVFKWIAPERALALVSLFGGSNNGNGHSERNGIHRSGAAGIPSPPSQSGAGDDSKFDSADRVRLLDCRAWFARDVPADRALEI